jgi:hypothetical protein
VDRRQARHNIGTGLVVGGIAILFFGLSFAFAGIYIT